VLKLPEIVGMEGVTDMKQLIHELQVRQSELEMQNDARGS
jgi:hypothetical protein